MRTTSSPLALCAAPLLAARRAIPVDDPPDPVRPEDLAALLANLRESSLGFLATRFRAGPVEAEETFAAAWERIWNRVHDATKPPIPRANLQAYVIRVLTNDCIRQGRWERRHVPEAQADGVASLPHSHERDALGRAAEDCIEGLPSDLEELLRHRYWAALPLQEFAIGRDLSVVRVSRLHTKALKLLLTCLKGKGLALPGSVAKRLQPKKRGDK